MKSDLMLLAAAFLPTLLIDTCFVAAGIWIPASVSIVNPPINNQFHWLFKP